MRIAVFTAMLVIPLAEYLFTGRLGLGAGLLLFVLLQLQSDRAADLFSRYGVRGLTGWRREAAEAAAIAAAAHAMHEARRPEASPAEAEEPAHVEVAPLGSRKRRPPHRYGPRPEPERECTQKILRPLPEQERGRTQKILRPAPERTRKILRPVAAASSGRAPAGASSATLAAPPAPRVTLRTPNFEGHPHEVLGLPPEAGTKQIVRAFRHWMQRYHPDHAPAGEASRATERARKLTEAKNALLKSRQNRAAA